MADIDSAIEFVLRQEDSRLAGTITDRKTDLGGLTRLGLTAKWHPALVTAKFYAYSVASGLQIPAIAVAQALPMALQAYQQDYANALFLASIGSQSAATALLSFAVVSNTPNAVRTLQQLLVSLGSAVSVDGGMGPQTVGALNQQAGDTFLPRFVAAQKAYFQQLVNRDPAQKANLAGWFNRSDSLLTLSDN